MIRYSARAIALAATLALTAAGCSGAKTDPAPASTSASATASGKGGQTYPTEGVGTTTAASGAAQPAPACAVDDSDQNVPTAAPATTAWPVVNGTGIPVSDTYGPVDRGAAEAWTCFSHSPTGALFGAAYIRPLTGLPTVRRAYITDDPGLSEGTHNADGVNLRGFKFRGYDPSTASLELVYETPSNGGSALVAFPVTLHWENGQWAMHKSDLEATQPRSITGLTGYVPWSVGA